MKIGVAQINPTVGDLDGNAELIHKSADQAYNAGCRLLVVPEMALTGYPPEDLLLKPAFIAANKKILAQLARTLPPLTAIIGFVDEHKNRRFNAAAWIEGGKIRSIYHKQALPNYGVFDEIRYFSPGVKPLVQMLDGFRIGITICEDIWVGPDALKDLKKLKPNFIVNISASPFHADKIALRQKAARDVAKFLKAPLLYANMTGGQDELVFDGGSFVCGPQGKVEIQFPFFESGLFIFEMGKIKSHSVVRGQSTPIPNTIAQIHQALIVGLRDYVQKNGFKKVVIGLSGGIDSALVAALAVEALGQENVVGITMPSRYNLQETQDDAGTLARNLGIEFRILPIQPMVTSMMDALLPHFKNTQPNIAEENLQARIRGNLLMALSNKFGWLVLTTGNKSEMSTGYCTLYGDTAGGFAMLKDVLKTSVYQLSNRINQVAGKEIIPISIIQRPPTAELKDNQKDEDSLGPYSELDPIIVDYVEGNLSFEIIQKKSRGTSDHIRKILKLIDQSEYKRRQAPPGIKITPRSFGRDHRMPITNRFRSG